MPPTGGANPLGQAADSFRQSTALLVTGVNQLRDLIGKIASEIGGLVRLHNPAVFKQFELSARDASAAVGQILTPTLRNLTAVVRSIGDGIASLSAPAKALVAGLASAAVGIGVLTAATVALGAAISAATGGISTILAAVVGGLAGTAFALRNVAEVQKAIEPVTRAFVRVFNAIGATVAQVVQALRPLMDALPALADQIGKVLAEAVRGAAPTIVSLAKTFAELAAQFAQMAPAVLQLAGVVLDLGRAVFAVQAGIVRGLAGVVGALLPPIVAAVRLIATLAQIALAPLIAGLQLIAPLVRLIFLPLEVPLRILGILVAKFSELVNAALAPVAAVMDELGAIAEDLAGLLAELLSDVLAELASLLPVLAPALRLAVGAFVSAMKMVVAAIREVADFVRFLFGLPARDRGEKDPMNRGASEGKAVRNARFSTVDDTIKQAQLAAFSMGNAQEPARQTATATSQMNTKFDRLLADTTAIRNAISVGKSLAGAAGIGGPEALAGAGPWAMRQAFRQVAG